MEFTLKTEQKQTLSHKMIQSSQILQMTTSQLEEYLGEQALENPVLELIPRQPEENGSRLMETYQWISSHDEQNRYLYNHLEAGGEEPAEWTTPQARPESLADYLWEQLLTKPVPSRWEPALRYLLDSLDENGYYTDSLTDFAARFQLEDETADRMLALVQDLEPAGVGARTLEECLCLQLKRQGLLTPEFENFINTSLTLVARNKLSTIARNTGLSMASIKKWRAIIRDLNPKPGSPFSDPNPPAYITPDVIVIRTGNQLKLWLNDNTLPDLTLNSDYLRMFQENQDSQVHDYLLQKIQQTQWLRQCIKQRNSTLMSVAQAILDMQQEFFFLGPDYLKPLKQSDIAGRLGIHVSTVSRALSQKYLQCSYGTFPFSSFFPKAAPVNAAGLSPQTVSHHSPSGLSPQPQGRDSSSGLSTQPQGRDSSSGLSSQPRGRDSASGLSTAQDVKKALAAIIRQEDAAKPYSDRVLAELLTDQGFSISRRTVAKYREELSIPGTSARKTFE